MEWWQIIIGIIAFILALGFLIGIHELGHLSAAKLFHVYCFNYSIGFGPKLLSTKRSAKHETIWSLRAVPLGGFVSMYGEGVDSDTNEFIPPSRSLEGIARYKRAIIISAGVFLNFVLGFILIVIHNGCFDHTYFNFTNYETREIATNDELFTTTIRNQTVVCNFNETMKKQGLKDGDCLEAFFDPFYSKFLLDQNLCINSAEPSYILCMSTQLQSDREDPKVSDSLIIYSRQDINTFTDSLIKNNIKLENLAVFMIANKYSITTGEISKSCVESFIKTPEFQDRIKDKTEDQIKQEYKKEVTKYYSNHGISYTIDAKNVYNIDTNTPILSAKVWAYSNHNPLQATITLEQNGNGGFKDIGIYLKRYFERYDFITTMKVSGREWCDANVAVFRGIGTLFTDVKQIGGIVEIANVSTSVLANFGFERFLYLWGLISCNLAIMNLLPFPGLDGWALTVIIYEGIRKKQIPSRVKGIISFIGLGLLFLLMIFITIKDVIGLF